MEPRLAARFVFQNVQINKSGSREVQQCLPATKIMVIHAEFVPIVYSVSHSFYLGLK